MNRSFLARRAKKASAEDQSPPQTVHCTQQCANYTDNITNYMDDSTKYEDHIANYTDQSAHAHITVKTIQY